MKRKYKGIILAGGSGTRLHPITLSVSKQLLPIYDKPMIYYPLSVLMQSGINEVLLISTPGDISNYQKLLGDGSQFGIDLSYQIQQNPEGIAQAFIIGENFIGDDNVSLILGDNVFFGENFEKKLFSASNRFDGATVFGFEVENPSSFGVIGFDENNKINSIEEKPIKPRSKFAVTGLYFYDNDVVKISKSLQPSQRGELEITDINNTYLAKNKLNVEILGKEFNWLDTGTHDSLIEAGSIIQKIEKTKNIKIGCLEEIAYNQKWISKEDILNQAEKYKKVSYGQYLKKIV
tara:strand:+ start:858 stop:1730 length:873 start_codon:yes stop_codon:yes gene_type:complete